MQDARNHVETTLLLINITNLAKGPIFQNKLLISISVTLLFNEFCQDPTLNLSDISITLILICQFTSLNKGKVPTQSQASMNVLELEGLLEKV